MSYDHLWIRNVDDSSRWADLCSSSLDETERRDLEADANRLNAAGNSVTLSAGGNFSHDEKILFETIEDAEEFFATGFRTWECFPGDGPIGCGFQDVSLYNSGQLIATKSVPGTIRGEAADE